MNYMPTVAYFSPAWPASIAASGIVSYVDGLARGIQSRGWKSVVLAGRIGETHALGDIAAYPVRRSSRLEQVVRKWLRQPTSFADNLATSFKQLIKKHQIDIIEMEESFGWAADVARAVPVPVIVRLHGPWFLTGAMSQDSDDVNFRARVRREGEGIQAAAGVTAPSQNVLDHVRDYYGFELPHARVIPNPVIPTILETPRNLVPRLTGRVVLYVGRFERIKGGDLAIKAFAQLAEQNKEVHFVFIGPDHGIQDSAGTNCGAMEYASQQFNDGTMGRFHFLGQQPPEIVHAWRLRADVIAITSRYESFCLALLEAMHVGKPIVATAVGGIPEIMSHDRTGLLVKPECVSSLAEAIQRLLDDPPLAARIANNGLQESQQRFSLDAVAEKSLAFYNRVLSQ